MLRSVRSSVFPSVRLSLPFSDSLRSLDGGMRASSLEMRSIGGKTVGYDHCIDAINGVISLRLVIPCWAHSMGP